MLSTPLASPAAAANPAVSAHRLHPPPPRVAPIAIGRPASRNPRHVPRVAANDGTLTSRSTSEITSDTMPLQRTSWRVNKTGALSGLERVEARAYTRPLSSST